MMSLSYIQLINPFPSNLQVTTDSVNPMLLKAIPPSSLQVCSDINSLPSGLTRLVVSSSHCQYSSLATVDLRNHSNLTSINVGDKVMVKENSVWYDGKTIPNFVYATQYIVIEVIKDRVVIGIDDKVTGAISINSLIKI